MSTGSPLGGPPPGWVPGGMFPVSNIAPVNGVPTELFMYPGSLHGIPDARNQLAKGMSDMAWMDYYVRGRGKKFSWRDVRNTLDDEKAKAKPKPSQMP